MSDGPRFGWTKEGGGDDVSSEGHGRRGKVLAFGVALRP